MDCCETNGFTRFPEISREPPLVARRGMLKGAALLAGVRSGRFADAHEAVAECVRVTGRVEPNASWTKAYDEGYERFRALYPALRPVT